MNSTDAQPRGYYLLIEGALFSIRHSQVRASGWEQWKQCSRRQCRNFRQAVSANNMYHRDVSARVDDHSWKVEEAIFNWSAQHQRRNVLAVGTEGDVMCCLVVSCSHSAAHSNDWLLTKVIQTDHITTVWARVITKGHAARPITRIKCNKQSHCWIVKQCLQNRTPNTHHTQ